MDELVDQLEKPGSWMVVGDSVFHVVVLGLTAGYGYWVEDRCVVKKPAGGPVNVLVVFC